MTTVPMELDLGTGYEYIYIFYMKFWSSVITNMATLWTLEIISDKFKVCGNFSGGNYAQMHN
jgi:hypothetical protein